MKRDLPKLREDIDAIDRELVRLLGERFRVTEEVGHYKKEHGLPPVDESREAAQAAKIEELAEEAELDPDFTLRLFRVIIDETVKRHKEIASS
jgi:chorismate mutase